MSPAHGPAPSPDTAEGVSPRAERQTIPFDCGARGCADCLAERGWCAALAAEQEQRYNHTDADAATASRIAAPMDMAADDRQQRWAATPAIEPTPVRVSPCAWRMITTAVTRREQGHAPVALVAARGYDGGLDASSIHGDATLRGDVPVVTLRDADPARDIMHRLVAVPVEGALHPLARDVAGFASVEAAAALDALVAEHGVARPFFLPRAAFRAWFATYGSALVTCDEVIDHLRRLVREDARTNGFLLVDVPDRCGHGPRQGGFVIESQRVGVVPFSFAEPRCPVCGAPATIAGASAFEDDGCDGNVHYTVALSCSFDPAHTADDGTTGDENRYEVTRRRFVFVSAAERDAARHDAVYGRADGTDTILTHDLRTGRGHILTSPTAARDIEDDPAKVWAFTYDGKPSLWFDIAGGIDGWLAIPGHPEILMLMTENWWGPLAGGDEALAEIRAMLPGVCLDGGDDLNRRRGLDALARLDPALLTAWAERWAGERGVFLTAEMALADAWADPCEWVGRLGYDLVIEGRDPDYDRLKAEVDTATAGLCLMGDGRVEWCDPATYGGD